MKVKIKSFLKKRFPWLHFKYKWRYGIFLFGKVWCQPKSVVDAKILSLAEIKEYISLSLRGVKYAVKGVEYGQRFAGSVTVFSSVFRGFFSGFYLRASCFRFFDKDISLMHRGWKSRQFVIEEPVFLLPYYNSHFGHFTGEFLGMIGLYSHFIGKNKGRRLLYFAPSDVVVGMMNLVCDKDAVLALDAEDVLIGDIFVKDGVLLPLCHPWQGLLWLRNYLDLSGFYDKRVGGKRVFLTSMRSERIINIEEVVSVLLGEGFVVMTPMSIDVDSYSVLRFARCLVTEDGSLSHLAVMHRRDPYFVLSPDHQFRYSPSEYFGGYVFNEIDFPRRQEIMCEVLETDKHIMSSRITVDVSVMMRVINQFIGCD